MRLLFPIVILIFIFIQTVMSGTVTPEFIRSLPPLPVDAVEEMKKHEHFDLAVGKKLVVTVTNNNDIGYGVTPDEIEDAITEGILPEGYRFPRTMTKYQANLWCKKITLLTYRSIVRKMVTVPLTSEQEAALVFFVQNTGRNNLKKLVNGPGRLNTGNYKSVEKVMPLYYKKERPEKKGLQKRLRFMLAVYKGESFVRKT